MRIPEFTHACIAQAIETDTTAPLLVHFGTDWCAPCKRLERVLTELMETWGDGVRVAKVNVEDEPAAAEAFEVTKNPTLCLFRDGQLVERKVGFRDHSAVLELLRVADEPTQDFSRLHR